MKPTVLDQILKDAHRALLSEETFLAIFDLDSTLFDLTRRIQEIHIAFANDPKWKAKYPRECAALAKVMVSPRDWAIREGLERAGMFEKDMPEFYHDIHKHWVKCFFSNDYLHMDEPLPGAVEFVRALEAEGAQIMYLTGRDIARMEMGTADSLRHWNFPMDEEHVELVLKPHYDIDDAEFKSAVISDATDEFDHIWLFENEPVNLNLIQQTSPSVHLVFIDTTHSGREQVPSELARIPHFEVDLIAFKKFKDEFKD